MQLSGDVRDFSLGPKLGHPPAGQCAVPICAQLHAATAWQTSQQAKQDQQLYGRASNTI